VDGKLGREEMRIEEPRKRGSSNGLGLCGISRDMAKICCRYEVEDVVATKKTIWISSPKHDGNSMDGGEAIVFGV